MAVEWNIIAKNTTEHGVLNNFTFDIVAGRNKKHSTFVYFDRKVVGKSITRIHFVRVQ